MLSNTRRSLTTQSVYSFSFTPVHVVPRSPALPTRPDPLGQPVVAHAKQRPRPEHAPRTLNCLDTLTSSSLEGVFVGEDAVVRRLAPGFYASKQHDDDHDQPVMRSTELIVVALKRGPCRAPVQDSLYCLGFHHSGTLSLQLKLKKLR